MIAPFQFLADLPTVLLAAVFLAATAAVTLTGVRTAGIGVRLAARTGLGEALMGAVFIGAVTSLPGTLASILGAAQGHPSLAISNGLGGIAAQTAFLAVADLAYRRANLEHAAAAPENLTQGALLIVLLGIVVLTMTAPEAAVLGVNPASLALIAVYGFGVSLVSRARDAPMWRPRATSETQPKESEADPRDRTPVTPLWASFGLWVSLLVAGGFVAAQTAVAILERTQVSETLFGAVAVAVATSMPELVIALGAVRRGALTLAVGNILGGNAYDVLFATFSDVAYRGGSIYHAISAKDRFVVALTLVMAGILMLGLLRRQMHGPANIGFESVAILALYAGGLAVLAL